MRLFVLARIVFFRSAIRFESELLFSLRSEAMDAINQARSFTKFTQRIQQAFLLTIMMVAVLLVALTNVALAPDNDTFDANELTGLTSLEVLWVGMPIHFILLIVLIKGLSVFSLIVRYKGGHTGQNYFNDRTIENNKLSFPAFFR